MIHAKKLKPGDRVNFHEYGWQTVLSVSKHGCDCTKVLFDSAGGKKEVIFCPRFDFLEEIVDGLYMLPRR